MQRKDSKKYERKAKKKNEIRRKESNKYARKAKKTKPGGGGENVVIETLTKTISNRNYVKGGGT